MVREVSRKQEQLEIAIGEDIESKTGAGWEDICFLHQCLPEVNRDEIDLAMNFLDKQLSRPLVISALTGGDSSATAINETLARAAEHWGLAIEVGSQRPLTQSGDMLHSYSVAREVAPHALIIGNIGAAQLINQRGSQALAPDEVQRLVEAIGADCLAVHLNFLQEAVSIDGDTRARGCIDAVGGLARVLFCPVIAKETGAGISRDQASVLKARGVAALDVAGAGGSSMALMESYRAARHGDRRHEKLGKTFAEWGVPTPIAVVESVASGLPVIASGGIRNGLDAAKALSLGARLVGVARPLLLCAVQGYEKVDQWLEEFFDELATTMFLVGASSLGDLATKRVVFLGRSREWLEQLGYGSSPPGSPRERIAKYNFR